MGRGLLWADGGRNLPIIMRIVSLDYYGTGRRHTQEATESYATRIRRYIILDRCVKLEPLTALQLLNPGHIYLFSAEYPQR